MPEEVVRPHNDWKKAFGGALPILNETLYQRLVQRFGEVRIAKQGERMMGAYSYDNRYEMINGGEYYRICCPFCAKQNTTDTRYRLWINHRWGVGPDEQEPGQNDKFWWAWVCYNEHCEQHPENTHQLRTWLYTGLGREREGQKIQIAEGVPAAALGLVQWPGRCIRLDQLAHGHIARMYVESRGFDASHIGKQYRVTYCEEVDSKYGMAQGRLIIPIIMQGEMVGWQARTPYDVDWKASGIPKYYNSPGINKRLMLYGHDDAVTEDFCIITEGVTDVWAVGPGAVCLLGKDMSAHQAEIIKMNWKAAVIALDADAGDRIRKINFMLDMPKVYITMPDGKDPADLTQKKFWDLLLSSATQQGVDLENL